MTDVPKVTLNVLSRKVAEVEAKLTRLRFNLKDFDLDTLNEIEQFVDRHMANNPAPDEPVVETPHKTYQQLNEKTEVETKLDLVMLPIEQEILHQVHILSGNTSPWLERLNFMLKNHKHYEAMLATPFHDMNLDVEDLTTLINELDDHIDEVLPATPVTESVAMKSSVQAMLENLENEASIVWTPATLVSRLRTEIAKMIGMAA